MKPHLISPIRIGGIWPLAVDSTVVVISLKRIDE